MLFSPASRSTLPRSESSLMLPAAFTVVAAVKMSLVLLSTSTQPPELMEVAACAAFMETPPAAVNVEDGSLRNRKPS